MVISITPGCLTAPKTVNNNRGGYMHAYLVQHGKAKPANEDPNRGLTDDGRAEVTRIADFMHDLRITISLIYHSGKLRAEETAHILATSIRCTGGPCQSDGLDPTDDPAGTVDFLNVYTDDILIVGHLPHLERLASLLLTGNADQRPIQFHNAGVVCLQKERNGRWSVVWAIVPELLSTPTRLAA
jgi:phosphohistidine phosphatase